MKNGEVRNDNTGRILKTYINKKNNYVYVDLWQNNKAKKCTIHKLLAETFIPNPQNKPTVDHKDTNRQNNSLDNLRWATYSEQNSRFDTCGVRSEKVLVTHIDGETMEFNRITDVANYFETTISNISQMLKKGTFGKRGKTKCYKFEYSSKK